MDKSKEAELIRNMIEQRKLYQVIANNGIKDNVEAMLEGREMMKSLRNLGIGA